MRIHLRNVINHALERGIKTGYRNSVRKAKSAAKTAKPTKKTTTTKSKVAEMNREQFMGTILESIWKSLDEIVDFRDEDMQDNPDDKRQIGFAATDAVANLMTEEFEFDDDFDEPEDIVYIPTNSQKNN